MLTAASDASQSPGLLALLALLVGIPLLVVALVSAIVLGPKWSRAGRWRPGQPWHNKPVWFGDGSPVDVDAVLAREVESGAAQAAIPAAGRTDSQAIGDIPAGGQSAEAISPSEPGNSATTQLGGARGRW